MIQIGPYDNNLSLAVFRALDPHDKIEAELTRGVATDHLSLFADWRNAQAHGVLSHILALDAAHGGAPFAVLVLGNTGQAGVAQAAMLACNHIKYRRALIHVAIAIKHEMPAFCTEVGIHRIEARSWAGHPTAAKFLTAIGFDFECNMPGFGGHGTASFNQFAWTNPDLKGDH